VRKLLAFAIAACASAKPAPNPSPKSSDGNTGKLDPYVERLRDDLDDLVSTTEECEIAWATVCIKLSLEGKLVDSDIQKSHPPSCAKLAERVIERFKKVRDEKPEPVPTHLHVLTERLVCFEVHTPIIL
jgi:hypothetical protein